MKVRVTFTGDPAPGKRGASDPDRISIYGLALELDEPVVVEVSPRIVDKLRGNGHFRVDVADETLVEAPTSTDDDDVASAPTATDDDSVSSAPVEAPIAAKVAAPRKRRGRS